MKAAGCHSVCVERSVCATWAPHTTKRVQQVWQFTLSDVKFKLVRPATALLKKAPEVACDKAKIVCVDVKLAPQGQD